MVYYNLVAAAFVILLGSCEVADYNGAVNGKNTKDISINADSVLRPKDPLPFLFLYDNLLSDGFDFPVGDINGQGVYYDKVSGISFNGWYVAVKTGVPYLLGVHTGEDWNGIGGGDTDLDQPVYSIGKGMVVAAGDFYSPWGNIVVIEHRFYENGRVDTIFSLYAHLNRVFVKEGDTIDKRVEIGTIGDGGGAYSAHLHFEIRKNTMRDLPVTYWPSSNDNDEEWVLNNYYKPTEFIELHRNIENPTDFECILIAIKSSYEMYYLINDTVAEKYEICLGMAEGHKKQHRDYKTPIGEYKVLNKSKGPFSGDYADFFGTGWIKLNYPNKYDALRGVEDGIITESQKSAIIDAIESGNVPPQGTSLGGGIGIHGWAGDWVADGTQNMTFGCICMHNDDMVGLIDLVEAGMTIVILP